jgi:hypothetical protein
MYEQPLGESMNSTPPLKIGFVLSLSVLLDC